MKKFITIEKKVEEVEDIICDICGKSCMDEWGSFAIEIKKYWGFSSKKDLEYWEADICEDCVDDKLSLIIPFRKQSYNPVTGIKRNRGE
jgi:superfamily II helicase